MSKRLRLKEDEVEIIHNYRRIKEEADREGIPMSSVHSGWLKNKSASLYFTNPLHGDKINQNDVEKWVGEAIKNLEPREYKSPKPKNNKALRIVISDCHVGMDSNDEDALFGFKYNEKIFNNHLDLSLIHI